VNQFGSNLNPLLNQFAQSEVCLDDLDEIPTGFWDLLNLACDEQVRSQTNIDYSCCRSALILPHIRGSEIQL